MIFYPIFCAFCTGNIRFGKFMPQPKEKFTDAAFLLFP